MFKIIKTKYYYFRIYQNAVEIKDMNNGQIIKRNSPNPFSSSRMLLADFELAEQFFISVIKEFEGPKIFKPSLYIVMQPMTLIDGGLCSVEKRAFRDSAQHCGARQVAVVNHTRYLSSKEFKMAFENTEYH